MDFSFSAEQLKTRMTYYEVCRELAKSRPDGFFGHSTVSSSEGWEYHRYCAKEFAKMGWLTLGWPSQYGGSGTIMNRVLLAEARGYHDIPGVDPFGVNMLAPTLLAKANEETKREFLPEIASGETTWCELWSEPNAGSDLAALTCTAIKKGDEYIINGQKIWTTGAHRANWGFGLFKSDPQGRKHHNLIFLLLDMETKGITIRPSLYMNGEHIYNEVYFDDVHVPARNIVGTENEGWAVTQVLAGFERSGLELIMSMQRRLEELVKYCNETSRNGRMLARDPLIRNKMAQIACELEATRTLSYRIVDLQSRGEIALMDASALKIFRSELAERMVILAMDILGIYGQVKLSKWSYSAGIWERAYSEYFVQIISMGTNEIQRNIIAWYGLGLPRSK